MKMHCASWDFPRVRCTANGRNPIPIIIPCHRVIGSGGQMTDFGGGIPTKEALLRLEFEHSQFPHSA